MTVDDDEGRKPKKLRSLAAPSDLVEDSWSLYLRFLDSIDDENPDGDLDELSEILDLLLPSVSKPSSQDIPQRFRRREELLPVMVSVASTCLADIEITRFLRIGNADNGSIIKRHICNALEYCPWNASAWSMTTNYARIAKKLSINQIGSWYHFTGVLAHDVRKYAIDLSEDDTLDNSVKEWIELLLLNQICGVELDGDDDNEFWSASTVEGTGRFMAAMQMSVSGQHAEALEHLQHFDLSHRLHPNVWIRNKTDSSPASSSRNSQYPAIYRNKGQDQILPESLYKELCQLFQPDAPYWKESDYDNRGYYSFFVDRAPQGLQPNNLIEEVIVNHLMPAVELHLGKKTADTICGYEWWVHTRPIQANLGHNLHFDTDEAMLSQQGEITHPILSSVLYLTGGASGGGPTLVLNQVPDAKEAAKMGWLVYPNDNQLLLFPGNLLHGVLPCSGEAKPGKITIDGSKPELDDLLEPTKNEPDHVINRLTFMVGFWTRRVPDGMKSRKLYGPCGPLPDASKANTWVQSMIRVKQDTINQVEKEMDKVDATKIEPVWETFDSHPEFTETNPPLAVPGAIDHRFFVKDAPTCFYDSLFQKDEFDDDDDDDEEEEDPKV